MFTLHAHYSSAYKSLEHPCCLHFYYHLDSLSNGASIASVHDSLVGIKKQLVSIQIFLDSKDVRSETVIWTVSRFFAHFMLDKSHSFICFARYFI